ncbi:hypothetical protein HID58_057711 [Brassica napus]|uniref:non-specific serine/threonine protein kinase n=1 Tax=Brassica napus TaxID=3708 RepID=A0ABQ8ASP4_BRANA|nr:hypothetical protein HID58_057711 [Brassica napus]
MARQRRRSLCLLITVWFLSGSVHVVRAQNRTGATTDPDEARALNSIFAAWRIPAPREWNISGELCSGAAMDDSVTIDDKAYNPLIKCDCTFNSSKICRITALKVYAIEVVGPIPPQLWTLHYLTNLNLGQNVLTGSLPPAIGNLTRMQYMTFGINALSGPVPKEIGLLKDLRSLSISSNNFSGSIPPEIGSCTKLQKMYIGSSGLTGVIPLSFANLVQLEDAWITDLQVTGPIPDFIGNWTKLTTLRIFGTGLSGPIPSSFSNLTSLTELRLGDISNGSSSLEIFKDMKSLSTLVFRNSNLTGTIPSFIGEFSSLQQVDLSFNKLGGPIPASLFNLSRLTHLFLGNNTLNGSLPSQKSQTLRNIDVSYNDLSGSLPSWVNLPNLKLNLVANNFSLEGLDKSVLPGLSCLQKDFPCNRGKALYSEFSINCGGPPIRSVSGALFEREDEELGPASFVRWAASSVGLFAGSSSNVYTATSQSQFINTLDSELFQSARLSASSLRYYGLGLENGGYTVTLQFAEIQILGSSSNTWRGLGRRRFDIYVQGRLVETDFDVRRTAGDSTVRAVQRVYKANVTENHLEIHLFWAGKGTCCIPIQGAYGPLISAVSAKSDFTPTVGNRPPSKGKNRTGTIVGVIVGVGLLSILAGVAIFIIRKRRKRYTDDEELLSMDVKPYTFTYSELKSATQDFDPSNKLGEGGFGPVYKYAMRGHLSEKTDVYAFGVVALELVSGRPNSDENLEDEKRYLLEWAWNLHEKSREVELIDRELTEFNMEEVKRMIGIALLCTQTSHALRPPMSRVVAMLSGDVEVSDVTSKPGYLTDWRFDDTTSSSLSGFQTKGTWASDSLSTSFVAPGSEISPGSADSKPMLGNLRRRGCPRACTSVSARALNSIFAAWRIPAPREWNISGELCSGAAMDDGVTIDDKAYNPLIKCDCTFNGSTICRITALKVYAMDAIGPIPPQLWTLTLLTNLNLAQNYLTGSLSPAIGNLTRMEWLTFGINALSGPVPKEIGLLTELKLLGISSNKFSGSIPAEIGNCTKLQQIYMDSSDFTGAIPSSFANLVELQTAWMMDLGVTGRIPDFIGRWTKLTALRIVGTDLSGPIPSSFSNLTSLTELRLGDISNGSSSLEFIKDMTSLSVLVLRNSNLTGTIPSYIGQFSSLKQVDLSFNKLHGPIPASLFNLSQLTHLFLGNNTLNGSLPTQKSQTLSNIDVSYNDLSGIPPSWVNLPNLQLNLVANNFTLESLDNRDLPGLNCLQKNFPCNRGKALYSDFAINCGGQQIRSASGAVFEREDGALGPASFVVSDEQRWGASSVGLFGGSSNIYIVTLLSQFINTLDSELFQSARLSASSLRYYGLGLENGGYTVTLQFAEIQIIGSSSNTWRGLGRRRFDIYVQGRLVERDFDIRRTANDSTVRAVVKEYKVNVSENYIEIHLFWAGKGTCCIPIQGAYGPLISAVSAKPDFIPTVANKPPSKGNNRTGTIVGVIVGLGLLSIIAGVVILIIRKRRKRYTDDEEILNMDVKPYTFSYSELKTATQDFNPSNKLGEGGFGPVYKGNLNDGREVAVKQLSVGSRQGKGHFVAEIVAISTVMHRNLVKLYGCCYEGDHRLLVYEYLPNGSLDQALFGRGDIKKTLHLDWPTRFEICMGVARGLAYLHEEGSVRIVHRDVKASNILLDSNLVPKVSDFGLAKLYDDKKTHISTKVAGTVGYLAPEYAMRGHLTEKTDVYAFGIVVLELVSGRGNADESLEGEKRYLLEWAWNLHEKSHEVELIDRELTEFNVEEVKRMIGIALLCTQASHAVRPPMSRVVAMLSGDVEVSEVTSKPIYLPDWRFDDTTRSSFSAFQTKDTGASGSYSTSFVTPAENDFKPMLGVKINDGR